MGEPMDRAVGARRVLLGRAAESAGEGWAMERIAELRADHRRIQGGWPGTLREARALLHTSLPPSLAAEACSPPTRDEIEQAVRQAYATARDTWHTQSQPDAEEGAAR